MANFSWKEFCEAHRVSFLSKGPNVKAGNIAVACPICGDDPSYHMSLSLSLAQPYWACWRDKRHAGRDPAHLVARLLRVSQAKAQAIVDGQRTAYADDLLTVVAQLGEKRPDTWRLRVASHPVFKSLSLPREIKRLTPGLYGDRYLRYLGQRGFEDAEEVAARFDLHYCLVGRFCGRLILPVYAQDRLVTWTGRDITGKAAVRYLTLSEAQSVVSIRRCLLFEDELAEGGDVLYLTEGPFDALKLAAYLPPGQKATCFFGMPARAQVVRLLRLAGKFRLVVSLLDPEAWPQNLALWHELSSMSRVTPGDLPRHAEDPGDLSAADVRKLAERFLRVAFTPAMYGRAVDAPVHNSAKRS